MHATLFKSDNLCEMLIGEKNNRAATEYGFNSQRRVLVTIEDFRVSKKFGDLLGRLDWAILVNNPSKIAKNFLAIFCNVA
ncbi:MAG: hypothetical protein B7X46_11360 [Thiomonas sp. 15-66-11]|nr:MAG: hypothetical protein B7X46_11360 [Thiomonas sp. 15-66-11]